MRSACSIEAHGSTGVLSVESARECGASVANRSSAPIGAAPFDRLRISRKVRIVDLLDAAKFGLVQKVRFEETTIRRTRRDLRRGGGGAWGTWGAAARAWGGGAAGAGGGARGGGGQRGGGGG